MSQSSIKELRKQLKNVVQEHLVDETFKIIETRLMTHIDKRLDAIQAHLNKCCEALDKRSKDVSSSLLRAIPPKLT
jgi:transcriptional regulator of heat shock response